MIGRTGARVGSTGRVVVVALTVVARTRRVVTRSAGHVDDKRQEAWKFFLSSSIRQKWEKAKEENEGKRQTVQAVAPFLGMLVLHENWYCIAVTSSPLVENIQTVYTMSLVWY